MSSSKSDGEARQLHRTEAGRPGSQLRAQAQGTEEDLRDKTVNGIILNVTHRVLSTPAVIIDALLGQGPALDCYNQQLQQAAVVGAHLANRKIDQALAVIDPCRSRPEGATLQQRLRYLLQTPQETEEERRRLQRCPTDGASTLGRFHLGRQFRARRGARHGPDGRRSGRAKPCGCGAAFSAGGRTRRLQSSGLVHTAVRRLADRCQHDSGGRTGDEPGTSTQFSNGSTRAWRKTSSGSTSSAFISRSTGWTSPSAISRG